MKPIKLFLLAGLFPLTAVQAQQFINPMQVPPVLTGPVFHLTANDTVAQFYPNITTNTFAYNGSYLGPTLVMDKGDSVQITIVNHLPEITTVHWHGMHVPSIADGGPQMTIPVGDSSQVGFRVMNEASTCWYHPHPHENTMPQVTKGLAGFLIVHDTVENALNLPRTYGTDDFPVVLQDRSYDGNGDFIIYALADSMLVNGTAKPYLDCPAQVVRLRLLNGSNVRNYNIGFSDNRNFYVIASDGGLLAQPYATNRLVISSGERYEILLDLGSDAPGDSLVMMSYATAFANNEPGGGGMPNGTRVLNAVDFGIMQINVTNPTASPVTAIPSSLITVNPWSSSSAVRTRNKPLAGMGMFDMGNFTIAGATFDMMVVNDTIYKDDIEIWHITNTSNVAHPFHIHDVPFYILSRNGNTPPAWEQGLKDVVYVRVNETIDIIAKFSDFTNDTLPYMYHCHNLAHEDMGMMLQFIVIEPPLSAGQANGSSGRVTAYPNPAAESWNMVLPENTGTPFSWTIYNELGQLVLSGTTAGGTNTLRVDCGNFAEGVYSFVLSDGEKVYRQKIVKSAE